MKSQVITILALSFLITSCTWDKSSTPSDPQVTGQMTWAQQEPTEFVPGDFEKMLLNSKESKKDNTPTTDLPELSEKEKVYIEWKEFYLARDLWSQELKNTELEYRNSIKLQLSKTDKTTLDTSASVAKEKWTQDFKTFQKSEKYLAYLKEKRATIDWINSKLQELMPEWIPIDDFTFYIP